MPISYRPDKIMTRRLTLCRHLLTATLLTTPAVFTAFLPAAYAAEDEAARTGWYFPAQTLPLAKVLAPPPAPGSAAQEKDLKTVRKAEAARTPELIAAVKADAHISVYRFADVMGPGFKPENLPLADKMFRHMSDDIRIAIMDAKKEFNRPRPFVADPKITTIVPQPPNASYPSGHTAFAFANAIVLSAMVPEKAAEIFARAHLYGLHRIMGGVHFPTDVEAGKVSGSVIGSNFLQSPRFQADFIAARKEVRHALGLPETP
ncbi:Acid phosphatase [Granulibacter bethesdensis CGDNIH4]|nr:Acid phosphatase [Granulibacter bethesdensis CGDNIH4]